MAEQAVPRTGRIRVNLRKLRSKDYRSFRSYRGRDGCLAESARGSHPGTNGAFGKSASDVRQTSIHCNTSGSAKEREATLAEEKHVGVPCRECSRFCICAFSKVYLGCDGRSPWKQHPFGDVALS